jgi:hypothetical protein
MPTLRTRSGIRACCKIGMKVVRRSRPRNVGSEYEDNALLSSPILAPGDCPGIESDKEVIVRYGWPFLLSGMATGNSGTSIPKI